MFGLAGKRALVTGASSGLGARFAEVLAAAGAHVILAARNQGPLSEVAVLIAAGGGSAETMTLDVSNPASITEAGQRIGAVDIIINNAGITNESRALDLTEADWDKVIDVNLKGMFLIAQQGARAMRDAGKPGSIVNIASILGLRQAGGVLPYAVSKAGVIQMTKSLALEVARFGVRVNALAPGYVSTGLNNEFLQTDQGRSLISRVPMRRLGEVGELDGPLLLLASDASRFMTGAVVVVDGGHLVSTL
ncbi:SDR family NAD(P)-dependent oxidoreductase [Sphingobium sp. CFD-2]|uniref:SDR family NAD(P)-dependent oxidoreductase n=1 Tax=Sphingobium sp. CFD-2 TaxID=2878542 RepID=UPI00214B261E|nr:SDR family oxidoreductase [Sphingobium sp. CFD-2]